MLSVVHRVDTLVKDFLIGAPLKGLTHSRPVSVSVQISVRSVIDMNTSPTKLKSREELSALWHKLLDSHFTDGIDLLQQLQEETRVGTIRECAKTADNEQLADMEEGNIATQGVIVRAILALLPTTQPQPEKKD